MSRIIFNAAVKCDKAGRKQNQDNYWLSTDLSVNNSQEVNDDIDISLSSLGAVFVVADGMGGENAGDKASEIVVNSIKERFTNITPSVLMDDKSILSYISESIVYADKNIKDYAKTHSEAEGLGSTIVLLWLLNGKAYCGWCGDSRIYRYNPNNKLVRLSHDHSYVQSLVDEGKIDESEAFDHPDGNIINRSLGDNGSKADPETRVYDIYERDVFLLCSDGLCGLLQDSEIEDIVSTHSSSTKDALGALWNAGDKLGWSDNATIELVSIGSGGQIAKGVAQGYPIVLPPQKKEKSAKDNKKKVEKSKEKWYKKPISMAILVAIIALLLLLYFWLNPGIDSIHRTNTEFNVDVPEQSGNLDNEQQNSMPGKPQKQDSQPQPVQPQKPQQQQQQQNPPQQQPSQQQGQQQGQNTPQQQPSQIPPVENLKPSPEYMNQLAATRNDYRKVASIWSEVKRSRYIDDEGEKQQLLSFAQNVTHLADPNNSDYKKLDNQHKQELSTWARLASDIKKNINKYNIGRPQPQRYNHDDDIYQYGGHDGPGNQI